MCATQSPREGTTEELPGDTCSSARNSRRRRRQPGRLGYVGEVTEVKVKLIKKEIADGFVPVISPLRRTLMAKLQRERRPGRGPVASELRARRSST